MSLRKNKLQWIRGLMVFSQLLLLAFTMQWLISQYNEQQAQLRQNLTKLFTDVQQKITDSLLLTNVIDPAFVNKGMYADASVQGGERRHKVNLSPQGLHKVLSGNTSITALEEKKLFSMDTSIFNEMFLHEMRHNGWYFSSRWINAGDSSSKGRNAIFIKSNFFTNANGVVINNYWWFLFWKMMPQVFFVLVLLTLTGTAFLVTFRNLKSQIRLSELKDDFISNMSHELKTPIATVKVALEALNHFNVIEDTRLSREYIGMAVSEMDRLELLATRVLHTSLLESGRIYLQQENYDLKMLVEEVITAMQPRIRSSGAKISFRQKGGQFLVNMDKLHMQGVLVNLLDNSLKYGMAPVHISIDLTEMDGAVTLSLADNGPGIPEEYKEKIFEKFFRIPEGNRHNIKGHGLGLSYARQVMRQHKGTIDVNNIAAGGCKFTLTF